MRYQRAPKNILVRSIACVCLSMLAMVFAVSSIMFIMTQEIMKDMRIANKLVVGSKDSVLTAESKENQDNVSPSLKRRKISGRDFFWEYPPQHSTNVPIDGILFIAHGCYHQATDFWSQSKTCLECIGLPEELAIVDIALNQFSFVVVATSSSGKNKCWSTDDGAVVAQGLEIITNEIVSENDYINEGCLPVYAQGISSGGYFVSSVLPNAMKALNLHLRGYLSQISVPPNEGRIEDIPAVFITMNRDTKIEKPVALAVHKINSKIGETKSLHIRLPPIPLTDTFFADRIGGYYSAEISTEMVRSLHNCDVINDSNEIIRNPRKPKWKNCLKRFASASADSMVSDESPLAEVLNTAFGMHEASRDGVKEALTFLKNCAGNPKISDCN